MYFVYLEHYFKCLKEFETIEKKSVFVGHFEVDTISQDIYGWETYTLNVNKFEEKVVPHARKSNIGKTIRILM